MSEPKECILVNIMYSGDYLNEKRSSSENIGHEWINLVKPDDPNQPHYIYITKDGNLDYNKYKISTVLFARAISKERGNNRVEVIAMATGCTPIDERARKRIGKINYGGVPLSKIFEQNEYHGESDPIAALATFTAKRVVRVKKEYSIVLYSEKSGEKGLAEVVSVRTSGKTREVQLTKCPNNQALRMYVDTKSKKFKNLLENHSLWDGEVSTLQIPKPSKEIQIPLSSCFLSLTGQLHDELSCSNMIAHFLLRHEGLRIDFLKWLGQMKKLQTTFKKRIVTIEREENHVDLLIRVDGGNRRYMIVIENKIRSNINGKKKQGKDQLDVYAQKTFDKCECKTMEEIHPLKNRRNSRKNSKNNNSAKKQASANTKETENKDCGRIPWFFLLTPKYNRFEESELSKTIKVVRKGKEDERKVEYTQIFYGDLHKCFLDFYRKEEWKPGCIEQVQFNEFLTALKAHDRTTDNINEDMMTERVLAAIDRIKNTPTKSTTPLRKPHG